MNDDWLIGDLQIGVPSGGADEERVVLTVTDNRSHIRFLELEVAPADFLLAITGRIQMGACRFRLRYPEGVGKYRENKHEEVFVPDGPFDEGEERARISVAEFEKDGWRGHVIDAQNQHCIIERTPDAGATYRVSFSRLVDDPPEEGERDA